MGADRPRRRGTGPFAKWWRDATIAGKAAAGSILPLFTMAALAALVVVAAGAGRHASSRLVPYVGWAALALAVVGGAGTLAVVIASARAFARRVASLELDANALALGAELEPMAPGSDELDHLAATLRRAGELLAEREATLSAIFAASPDPVVMLGEDGRVLYASRALSVVTGHPPADWVGDTLWDHMHPADAPTASVTVGAVAGEPHARVTVRARVSHALGGWVPVEIHGQGMSGSKHVGQGAVVVLRDVTERERLEALWQEALEAAEKANAAKSNFVSRMSHEMRTPLNAMLGFSQLLQMEGLPPSQLASVGQIIKAGQHLLRLVNESLDIAKVESGRLPLHFTALECSAVMAEVVDMVAALAAGANVSTSIELPQGSLWVRADRDRLSEILLNLVANGIKYGGSGGRVVLRAEAESDRVRIEVSDRGPGIDPERLGEIFLPFERAGAEESGTEGHGLGLSLSQKLAEAMGGELGVRSALGEGSTFFLTLQRCMDPSEGGLPGGVNWTAPGIPRPERTPEAAAEQECSPSGTLLYVEDNPAAVALMERALDRRPGVRLLVAGRAATAMELARSHRPDLIIVDAHLPDARGEELVEKIRAEPETGSLACVLLGAERAGGRDRVHLAKPIEEERLLEVVDTFVGRSRRAPA